MSDPRSLTEIGPYRIESRLGSGGMGEVYRAYDSRLGRSVAVKLIRLESSGDAVARERFRREARAAAGLSHPSIVQVHDIVESGEGDAIVMELVEGETLAQKIAAGPIRLGECARLAREIAEALAAAHARQILHRDLKPSNIMVTPDGHAKILDFGLAKRMDDEATLTHSAAVVGTFRAMSPEQARGLPLDHRSDLFSFGTLLYEMLTGQSPFRGATTLETLTRVCSQRQMPVRDLRPEVPAELAQLVDCLLEKEPMLRPRSAREVSQALQELAGAASPEDSVSTFVETARSEPSSPGRSIWRSRAGRIALTAVTVALGGAAVLVLTRSRAEPLYVAVPQARTAGKSGDERIGLAEAAVRSSVLDALPSFEKVFPLAPDQVDEASGSVTQIARTLGANELITSRLSCGTDVCDVVLSRIGGSDGRLLWSGRFQAPLERPDLAADAVRAHLLRAYRERHVRGGASEIEVRPADYAEYLRLFRSFDTHEEQELPVDKILARLPALRAGSPRFPGTYLFESEVLEYRFRTGRDRADLERAFDVLAKAHELWPDDPRPMFRQISVALTGGQLDRAETALRVLELLQPGDARVLSQRARLLDQRGETAKALELAETAARRLPLWKHLFWAADMSYRLGRIAAARSLLEELLRRSPGHYVGQSKLAEIELMNGSPQRAVALYTDLVRRSPQYGELTNLGLAWSLLGHYGDAEARYRQALALAPESPLALLNLADAAQLGGHGVEAEALYRQVLRASEKDPGGATNIQILSVRAQAQAHLGQSGKALRAMQEALRLAPENPQTAYEAAVVYSVLGDRAS
ncbi:MAG TPA: protein kinase, partial [Thermoanaerobaculia bacterium]